VPEKALEVHLRNTLDLVLAAAGLLSANSEKKP